MDVLKCPSKTVMYSPSVNETILVAVNQVQDNTLQKVSKQFGDQLEAAIRESNR